MRNRVLCPSAALRPPLRCGSGLDRPHDAEGFRGALSGLARRALRTSLARMESVVCSQRLDDPSPGAFSGGGQRASGAGRADGGAFGPAGGGRDDGAFRFDALVDPGGYAWWYVDALSDDGAHGLTVIAFIGSVFSPYYAWSGHKDPGDHCAVNIALYGPHGSLWAMTERGRSAVSRNADSLVIGPSSLSWDGSKLTIQFHETSAPIPRRLRGRIVVEPAALNAQEYSLEAKGVHVWRPIAPVARVSADLAAPELSWRGPGYLDHNRGAEPLEDGFSRWTWSRAQTPSGTSILYDADRLREPPLSLALRFDREGRCEKFTPPPRVVLPKTRWRVARETRSDDGRAGVERRFEDTPFYSRSLVAHSVEGVPVVSMHESLDLRRFASPIVRAMLPFRMPRW